MARFTLPRDIYHGKGCLEELKNLKGKKAVLVVGGGSMKRQGFLDKRCKLPERGRHGSCSCSKASSRIPSVETVMKGAEAMQRVPAGLDRSNGRRFPNRRSKSYVGVL